MRTLLAALAGILVVAVLAVFSTAALATSCRGVDHGVPGSPAGILHLSASGVGCSRARGIAVTVTGQVTFNRRHYRYRGYACSTGRPSDELHVRCVDRHRQRVSWAIGD